jgi:hypothetical protein
MASFLTELDERKRELEHDNPAGKSGTCRTRTEL